jgi:hypothetical protein
MEITRFIPNIYNIVGHQAITLSQTLPNTLLGNVFVNICGNTQTLNLGAIPWLPMLNELNNQNEIPLSTL